MRKITKLNWKTTKFKRKFIKNLVNILPEILMNNNSIAIFEIDPSQAEYFYNLRNIFKVEIIKDIQSLNRVAILSLND